MVETKEDEIRTYLSVFASVLIAEMGDKTQLAAMLFASDSRLSPIGILVAASAALIVAAAVGVFAGATVGRTLPPHLLRTIAGTAFVAIGIWMLFARGV
jgi:putative Ca2+/H+ antiporter (TMEM165/GDT1 family)